MNTKDQHEYSRIADLIGKRINGEINPEEQAELDGWLLHNPTGKAMYERLSDEAQRHEALRRMGRFDEEAAWARLEEKTETDNNNILPLHSRKLIRYASAAAIVTGLTIGAYFLIHQKQPLKTAQNQEQLIQAGGNKAILTLANGRQILLTGAKNGVLARQAGTSITKAADGKVVYDDQSKTTGNESAAVYNTIMTPRGGQYQVVLPDGTKVWLNAASSLKYPVVFTGTERTIELTGEAYLEVAHNTRQRFRVITPKQVIEDVGTHFNVNCYADEPSAQTTLLEGAVKVNDQLLKPGEQATLNPSGKLTVEETDAGEAIAWKNGKFVFDQEDIPGIMRKLARWYDVEVSYSGDFSGKTFTGSISRFDDISKILDKITFTSDIHFKIEGRRIAVSR